MVYRACVVMGLGRGAIVGGQATDTGKPDSEPGARHSGKPDSEMGPLEARSVGWQR
jgi:hypothetical protein